MGEQLTPEAVERLSALHAMIKEAVRFGYAQLSKQEARDIDAVLTDRRADAERIKALEGAAREVLGAAEYEDGLFAAINVPAMCDALQVLRAALNPTQERPA